MKNTKAKAAPAIVWEKGDWPCEWAGSIGGKHYSSFRSAKRGAERLAKRMREIFA